MELVIKVFLLFLAIYFLIGFLFGLFFIFRAPKIDPLMSDSKKKVRILLFPGVMATWPFLIGKLFKSKTN
ncbi:hypothetical protein RM697_10090 [Ichthyenterobacterium sp. W332]|uniref:Uncharacterized protein n=1 Tax=Microcosmobacter mediterraneus TaxID=3075607 RepID=A0ABU2YLH3_9FLAO|nr:hypothetical protein [Ichthyenterobacterium sp. W332]MDT0558999.1 hypothetical protein [Ichthyenterobacterium sp. W332]